MLILNVHCARYDDLPNSFLDRVTINITRVLASGELLPLADIAQVNVLISNGGDLLLRTLNGTQFVNDGDANGFGKNQLGRGSMILQTMGTNHDIVLNTDLLTQAGVVGRIAQESIIGMTGADPPTQDGVINVGAIDGSILLADASLVCFDSQTVRFNPDALDVTLGTISASPPRRDDDGNLIDITGATLSNLTTGTNCSILAVSAAGTITINGGADADGLGIIAGGAGNVSVIGNVDVVQVVEGDIAANVDTLPVEPANDVTLGSLNTGAGSVLIKAATGVMPDDSR